MLYKLIFDFDYLETVDKLARDHRNRVVAQLGLLQHTHPALAVLGVVHPVGLHVKVRTSSLVPLLGNDYCGPNFFFLNSL